jgi:hypothetical protein
LLVPVSMHRGLRPGLLRWLTGKAGISLKKLLEEP